MGDLNLCRPNTSSSHLWCIVHIHLNPLLVVCIPIVKKCIKIVLTTLILTENSVTEVQKKELIKQLHEI